MEVIVEEKANRCVSVISGLWDSHKKRDSIGKTVGLTPSFLLM